DDPANQHDLSGCVRVVPEFEGCLPRGRLRLDSVYDGSVRRRLRTARQEVGAAVKTVTQRVYQRRFSLRVGRVRRANAPLCRETLRRGSYFLRIRLSPRTLAAGVSQRHSGVRSAGGYFRIGKEKNSQ